MGFYSGNSAVFIFLFLLVPYALAQPSTTGPDDPYRYARFNPSMAVIVVILVSALFFMAFFSIYIRRCNDATGSVLPIAGARSRRATAAARGLDPSVIEKFPTFAYSAVKDLKIGKGALECAVCLSEFDEDETLRLLPKCDHVFHPDCIDAWLASHTTCPVCRADLVPTESSPADDRVEVAVVEEEQPQTVLVDPVVINFSTGTAGSTRGSGRPPKFPRSHSTGHSGEDTERFTLRLPAEVRKQIMANRALNRATSMVVLPREGSSRRGYRGARSYRRMESFGLAAKSDRWVFTMAPPFFVRESSFKSPKLTTDQEASDLPKPPSFFNRAFSFKLPKQAAREEGTSGSQKPQSSDSPRPPPPV